MREYYKNHSEIMKARVKWYTVSNPAKVSAQRKVSRSIHHKEIVERRKRYYLDNREEIQKKTRKYQEEHVPQTKELRRQWYSKNREAVLKQRRSPQGRLRQYKDGANHRGLLWDLTDERALELFSLPCYYCGGSGH